MRVYIYIYIYIYPQGVPAPGGDLLILSSNERKRKYPQGVHAGIITVYWDNIY